MRIAAISLKKKSLSREDQLMKGKMYSEVLGYESGLRLGLSTGSCAQAAAKAALLGLLTRTAVTEIEITLPTGKRHFSGKKVTVPVEFVDIQENEARAFVIKDAGDDKDITNGMRIGAVVHIIPTEEGGERVIVTGGPGVGRITKPGIPGKIGEAAINPVPRKMIRQECESVLPEGKSCIVTITVPGGEVIAEKTWNPRIGIIGGISIIGTRGIVEPRSEEAYKVSINTVIHTYRRNGRTGFIITSGYVGEKYLTAKNIPMDRVVTAGDHIGHALKRIVKSGGREVIIAAHAGKLVKLCAGIFNTHWKSGDGRLEILAAYAGACGASAAIIRRILSLDLAENAVDVFSKNSLEQVWTMVCEKAVFRTRLFLEKQYGYQGPRISLGSIVLSLSGEPLGYWPADIFRSPLLAPAGEEVC